MASTEMRLPLSTIMRNTMMIINVSVVNTHIERTQIWMAIKLLRLAAYVLGCKMSINMSNPDA